MVAINCFFVFFSSHASSGVISAMFEAKATKYINAYVFIMHMVDAMSTPGITGDWLTILEPLSDFSRWNP